MPGKKVAGSGLTAPPLNTSWARPLRAVCAGRDNSCFSSLDFSLDRDSMLGAWGVVGCGGAKSGGIGGVGVWLGLGGG